MADLQIISAFSIAPEVEARAEGPYLRRPDLAPLERELLGKRMRRVGGFIRLAALGAVGCLKESGLTPAPERLGVFMGSGLANHEEETDVVRAALSDVMPSPIRFANSVSNSVAFFTAQAVEARGMSMLVSQEEFSFESAVILADMALALGEVDYALVGGADDLGISQYKTLLDRLGMPEGTILGEGCGWMLLGRGQKAGLGRILLAEQIKAPSKVRDAGSNPLSLIKGKILESRLPDEEVYLLPGLRAPGREVETLAEEIPLARVEPFLEQTGIFSTACACCLAGRLRNPKRRGLIVHLARNSLGDWSLLMLRS